MEDIIVILMIIFPLCLIASSIRHHLRLRRILQSKIEYDLDIAQRLLRHFNLDDTAFAGVSYFDILHHALTTDTKSFNILSSPHNASIIANTGSLKDIDFYTSNLSVSPLAGENMILVDEHLYLPGDDVFTGQLVNFVPESIDIDVLHPVSPDASVSHYGPAAFIPIAALVINAARNAVRYYSGQIDSETAVELTVVDSAASATGAIIGAKIGTNIGLFFAPFTGGTSTIIAPTICGLIGALTGKAAVRNWRTRHIRRAHRDLCKRALKLRNLFIENFNKLCWVLKNRHRQNMSNLRRVLRQEEFLLKRIFFPSTKVISLRWSIARYKREFRTGILFRYRLLLKDVTTCQDPVDGGMLVYDQGKETLLDIPPLVKARRQVRHALRNQKKEIKKYRAKYGNK